MLDTSFGKVVKKVMPIVEDELKRNNLILRKRKFKRFTKKMMAIFYGKGDSFNEEWIREMTVASIQGLIMPVFKNELMKNRVFIDERDILFMTYDIVQETRKNSRGYSDHELRKIAQECSSKNIYKNYTCYSYSEDLKKAMPIVDDELKRNNLILGEEKLKGVSKHVLRELYIKGGWYKEKWIRDMSIDGAAFFIEPIVQNELKKNNVVMDSEDIDRMIHDMMETSKKNGGGYSEPEMRKITQEYISKNLYKNYMGYSKRILPTTDQKNKWSVNEHIKKKRKNLFNSIINTVKVWYYKQGNKNR